MNTDEYIDIPNHVDEFDHFLIWQVDEIISVGVGLIFGILAGSPMIGIGIGVLMRNKYIALRDGKPTGFFSHKLRELGFTYCKGDACTSMQPPLVDKYIQ
ncbi:type IV conjugative transfer system protein TraL [Photobacterium leiognathi]|uniref:type IV conjugative transfer system protein TraL n=1 Tax=Photobacterium leiognathi TaxID=553611 RepID=UPI002738B4B6|nr:type IV conjugative transfer system protein TraL [Photobacterium leiognathi]